MEFNGENLELCEDFIDIGYMGENVEVKTLDDETFEIKRSHEDKSMTLLVSLPDLQETFVKEALKLDHFMHDIEVPIHCYFIFDKKYDGLTNLNEKLKKFTTVYDHDEEYGNMYGTKIVSSSLEDKLTKALFLISKDGAVFYLEMKENLAEDFDLQRLQAELNKAFVSYTGVGCHG